MPAPAPRRSTPQVADEIRMHITSQAVEVNTVRQQSRQRITVRRLTPTRAPAW